MASKMMLNVREMQSETTVRCHFTSTKRAAIKKSNNVSEHTEILLVRIQNSTPQ
jgi:hypothetical protein